jgi:hypothetical protein
MPALLRLGDSISSDSGNVPNLGPTPDGSDVFTLYASYMSLTVQPTGCHLLGLHQVFGTFRSGRFRNCADHKKDTPVVEKQR